MVSRKRPVKRQAGKGTLPGNIEIVAINVQALQSVYLAAMLEEAKVFLVVDRLVELFQTGMLTIGRSPAGNNLYKYWKQSQLRISVADRRNFYARLFGFPGGDAGAVVNREFDDLWLRFVSAVASVGRQKRVSKVLSEEVRKTGRDLAANLSAHGVGVVYFVAADLKKQIDDVVRILSDPEVKSAYAAQDMWQVVRQVAVLELGGAPNIQRYRTMAISGSIIIAWLAKNAQKLSGKSPITMLRRHAIRKAAAQSGLKPKTNPTDSDLVNACEQWLAVAGTVVS